MKKLFTLCFALLFLNGWAQCPWTFTINPPWGNYSITCSNPTINLSASTNNTNTVNYLWTGPTFTSNINTASIALPGNYTLVATDAVTSCSMMQTFSVLVNTVAPTTSVSPVTQTIGCLGSLVSFSGTVSNPTINIQHDWYSPLNPLPGGVPIANSNNSISVLAGALPQGTYSLITTDLVNGCTTQKTVTVIQSTNSVSFSHSVIAGGVVNFTSTSTGTNGGTTYSWDFGDGGTATGIIASHTYSNGGIHNVYLNTFNPNCYNYNPVFVNTIPCVANSNFTLIYSGVPQNWWAVPNYYGNVSNAFWSWGDGNYDGTLFPSHTYSAAGFYNICFDVITSCGTSSTCSGYNIYRSSVNLDMAMVTVSVVPKVPVGIKTIEADNNLFSLYPNPTNSTIYIQNPSQKNGTIKVFNFEGKEIETLNLESSKETKIENLSSGIYFVEIKVDDGFYRKKIAVVK